VTRQLALRIAIGVLTLAGIGIASYLTVIHFSSGSLYCPVGGGCETVQKSPESKLLGVPVAALGLASYLIVFATVFLRDQRALLLAATLALVGIAFSGWLLYVMLVRIDAVCAWCVGNDIVALLLAPLALTRYLSEEPAPA
jgi:uncharacterized membrane protein